MSHSSLINDHSPDKSESIVFFDGYCNLCNTSVDFLLSRDKRKLLKFAPLHGSTAKKRIPSRLRTGVDSIIFFHNGTFHVRSDAAIEAMALLGRTGKLLRILKIIPRPIRDVFYDFIARHRYQWFGKKESCRIPTAEEREWFLD
ncbi:MAG TPA: DUF393 domain-containing protein [Caldithrix abyssi]|uniref:DUF393 domain-containing protein n=1 Tax=Caldithrix abyssi TaxID=187145 RepID=A0A7V1LLL1_CALAY|nr:DUF393 domain-containing protein [Caldithrix abyssi]